MRLAHDAYQTPPLLAAAACGYLLRGPLWGRCPEVIWEPHAGRGHFVAAARAAWTRARIEAFDLQAAMEPSARAAGATVFHASDWLLPVETLDGRCPDLILGNPPFDGAVDHVERALDRVTPGGHVALLLRCDYLWPTEAKDALWGLPGMLAVQPFSPRANFVGSGTDTVGCALWVWRDGYRGPAELARPLWWRAVRSSRRAG